jgi:FKBP-type peptidyl-prolyl cis-trans isomerase FkpA
VEFAVDKLVPGLREGVKLMSAGGHYRVVVPGEHGYGMQGMGRHVSPNATLIFDVELVEVSG